MVSALGKGALLIVAGMAIIGLIDNLIRLVAEEAGLFQFHFLRSCIAVPVLVGLGWIGWARLTVARPGWVALRTVFLIASMMLYFAALPVLPIAQVAAGLFTAPIFVLLITVALLRRPVGPIRVAAVGVGFLGVLVLLAPDAGNPGDLEPDPGARGGLLRRRQRHPARALRRRADRGDAARLLRRHGAGRPCRGPGAVCDRGRGRVVCHHALGQPEPASGAGCFWCMRWVRWWPWRC